MLVFLDTCTLGRIVSPNNSSKSIAIRQWMWSHLANGVLFRIPAIADYELRRNLILETIGKPNSLSHQSLRNLDTIQKTVEYVPLSKAMLLSAAALWAAARKGGYSTAHKFKLDGDVILAAQAIVTSAAKERIIIATRNVRHLSRYSTNTVEAREWSNI